MGEDMTYTTEPTRAQLAARVAELERERDELRARLDKWNFAPFWANYCVQDSRGVILEWSGEYPEFGEYEQAQGYVVTERPQATHAADDDTDAPLKLATVEGDE